MELGRRSVLFYHKERNRRRESQNSQGRTTFRNSLISPDSRGTLLVIGEKVPRGASRQKISPSDRQGAAHPEKYKKTTQRLSVPPAADAAPATGQFCLKTSLLCEFFLRLWCRWKQSGDFYFHGVKLDWLLLENRLSDDCTHTPHRHMPHLSAQGDSASGL
jgi:hypothetical protein